MSVIRQVNELRPGDWVELIRGEDAASFLLAREDPGGRPVLKKASVVRVSVVGLSTGEADGSVRVVFSLTAFGFFGKLPPLGHRTVIFWGRETVHVIPYAGRP